MCFSHRASLENIALLSIPCRSAVTCEIYYFSINTSGWHLQHLLHLNLGDSVSSSCCKWSRKPNSAGMKKAFVILSSSHPYGSQFFLLWKLFWLSEFTFYHMCIGLEDKPNYHREGKGHLRSFVWQVISLIRNTSGKTTFFCVFRQHFYTFYIFIANYTVL